MQSASASPNSMLQTALKGRDFTKAISIYEGIAEPKDQATKMFGAFAYFGAKDYKKAKPLLDELHQKDQQNSYITMMLAETYDNLGDADEASYFYTKATKYPEFRLKATEKLKELKESQEVDSDRELIKDLRPFKSNLSFKDVMGLEKQKEYMTTHIIMVIRDTELFRENGKKLGNAVLLFGPPGTGKTYLAKALAGESNSYMIIGRISDLLGEYQGVTEKNLKQIFRQARMNKPCIIFFDEIDALGGKRENFGGSDQHGGTGALKIAVSQFLTELQGVETSPEGIFVVAATNAPWSMDPALKRSGRLSDTLYIGAPDYRERIASFGYHLSRIYHKPKIDLGRLSRAAIGYSQADIEKICDDMASSNALIEKRTGEKHYASTKDMLKLIRKQKNTLDEWYANTRKDLLGRRKVSLINGKREVTWVPGNLEPEEKMLYADLIKDIRRISSPRYILHKRMQRFVALNVW